MVREAEISCTPAHLPFFFPLTPPLLLTGISHVGWARRKCLHMSPESEGAG